MPLARTIQACVCALLFFAGGQSAVASGLIWNLPADGSWIRYEGTYKQQKIRPEAADGNLDYEWIRQITIKSVGKADAEFEGRSQACRWIEIKSVTGKRSEAGIDAGPAGSRIYKVLVPESKVLGTHVDRNGIQVSMLPIVKGYRRYGEGRVAKITAKALQISPTISLVSHYKTMETVNPAATANVPGGDFEAKQISAQSKMERETSRSTNRAELWVSNEVPFGLVKWKVTVDRQVKDLTDSRAEFRETSKAVVEMAAAEIGDSAQSELTEE